jgi:hypothetical protein
MTETIFDKSPDIEGQIPPGPVIPFKLVVFPDTSKGQTFVQYDSAGKELGGFCIPRHDQEIIDEALAPATTVITYKLAGVTVATKTITVSGTTTTITMS